jgi:hypothetical protein
MRVGKPGSDDVAYRREVREFYRENLERFIGEITFDELRWQDANFERDAALGRELLYLIANDDWVRATCETIDIKRSDSVETTIKVEIDFDRITHEAFRDRYHNSLWLPVLVLPPPRMHPVPDPLATLKVTGADGSLLATLPSPDTQRRISAALAEIVFAVAVARLNDVVQALKLPDVVIDQDAKRDARLLLSAAIYRLLRKPLLPGPHERRGDPEPRESDREAEPFRLRQARGLLLRVLEPYFALIDLGERESGPPSAGIDPHALCYLAERAMDLLSALAVSVIVVVAARRSDTPTVMTVHTPSRQLRHPRVYLPWRWLGSFVTAAARLEIGLLLASADADRKIQLNLPMGVSFITSQWPAGSADLSIETEPPLELTELLSLVDQIEQELSQPADSQGTHTTVISQCLADLALVKLHSVSEALLDHEVRSSRWRPWRGRTPRLIDQRVKEASRALVRICAGDRARDGLADANGPAGFERFRWRRAATVDSISPEVVVARAHADVPYHARPTRAQLRVQVAAADIGDILVARLSGVMSAVLMGGVLWFYYHLQHKPGDHRADTEILVTVLTLFSVIQAGRISRTDSSTLAGLLGKASNLPTIAVILPTMLLAITLAFYHSVRAQIGWCWWCVGLQMALLGLLLIFKRFREQATQHREHQRTWFRPVAGWLRFITENILSTEEPDFFYSEFLRSPWWRSVTAGMLKISKPAYGYVIREHSGHLDLGELLRAGRPAPHRSAAVSTELPPHVLALQRSSMIRQSVNFVVFRDRPVAEWSPTRADSLVVELDPDRLVPLEESPDLVSIYVGLERGRLFPVSGHPVKTVLAVCGANLLPAREVQMPVPAPAAAYQDKIWARVQVAIRENDEKYTGRLRGFLADLCARKWDDVVAVQMVPEGVLRIISPLAAGSAPVLPGPAGGNSEPTLPPGAARPLIYAADLDVVNASRREAYEGSGTRVWRELAICADWRIGNCAMVLDQVDQDLELAGFTAGDLFGQTVLILLGRERPGSAGQPPLGEISLPGSGGAKMITYLDKKVSRAQLGAEGHHRHALLAVHMQTPDRPGAILAVLDSVREAFNEIASSSLLGGTAVPAEHWKVWYANVAANDVGVIRLTICLEADPRAVPSEKYALARWTRADFEQLERRALVRAITKIKEMYGQAGSGDLDFDTLAETKIALQLLEVPVPEARVPEAPVLEGPVPGPSAGGRDPGDTGSRPKEMLEASD